MRNQPHGFDRHFCEAALQERYQKNYQCFAPIQDPPLTLSKSKTWKQAVLVSGITREVYRRTASGAAA
jgi:hypothetical protein